jgi:hypothetical protein
MVWTRRKATTTTRSGNQETGGSMAAKQPSPLETLKTYQPRRQGFPTWDQKLRSDNPKLMAEIDSVIDGWIAEKHRDKLKTENALALFVLDFTKGYAANQPPVRKYINKRRGTA